MLTFQELKKDLSLCKRCVNQLPQLPRPILRGLPSAKILIIGQAPGLKAHQTNLSFNDASGERLRAWLGIQRDQFYDETKIAIMPIGFCFPGKNNKGGDLPPIKGCAAYWHPQLLPFFPNVKLTVLVGGYAQKFYLKDKSRVSVTKTVQAFEDFLPQYFCLPHPSWRNTGWIKRHPWFEHLLLPKLKQTIQTFLQEI